MAVRAVSIIRLLCLKHGGLHQYFPTKWIERYIFDKGCGIQESFPSSVFLKLLTSQTKAAVLTAQTHVQVRTSYHHSGRLLHFAVGVILA